MTVQEMIQSAEIENEKTFEELLDRAEDIIAAEMWKLETFHKVYKFRALNNIPLPTAIRIISSNGQNIEDAKRKGKEELKNEVEKTLGAINLCRKVNRVYEKRRK